MKKMPERKGQCSCPSRMCGGRGADWGQRGSHLGTKHPSHTGALSTKNTRTFLPLRARLLFFSTDFHQNLLSCNSLAFTVTLLLRVMSNYFLPLAAQAMTLPMTGMRSLIWGKENERFQGKSGHLSVSDWCSSQMWLLQLQKALG